ncbi:MAG: hypothetical protein R3D27_10225 [Hyphomicrobiaceae bacterium]
MTTIDAAVARRASWRAALGLSTILVAGGLAGCGSSSNILGGEQAAVAPPPLAATGSAAQPAKSGRRIALSPVIGAPEQVAQQIASALNASAGRQNVVIVGANEPAEFTLRGYIVAAAERSGTKVSYIWDVSSPTGQRVNRITGEETIKGAAAKDPWASVSPAIVQTIADKTAGSLSTWLISQPASAAPAVPVASAAPAAPPSAAGAQPTPTLSAPRVASAAPTAAQATASLPKATGPASAFVPKVVGAPGDGSTALARALQEELQRNGIALAAQPSTAAHKVEGKVAMGQPKDGQQTIKIDWVLTKPDGSFGGQVTQNNAIPAGSLDGAWGPTAGEAAKAAAKGLIELIAKPTATN